MNTLINIVDRSDSDMKRLIKLAALPAIFISLVNIPSVTSAADIMFSFRDDGTPHFFGREHITGTVTGILRGLVDNAFSAPTAVQFLSSPDEIGLVEGAYTFETFVSGGFRLSNGAVVDANYAMNFRDSGGNPFQLRLGCNNGGVFDCSGDTADLNLLFWNGGTTPVVGTGNQLGFFGVVYTDVAVTAVPELLPWSMMLAGFGTIGCAIRRRQNVTFRFA